jgi:chlorobactene glucosyltransferase
MTPATDVSQAIIVGALCAIPWVALPIIAVVRQRQAKSLADYDANVDGETERVSIVLPARNEAAHVAECVASLRATAWPNVEVIVVNDHSTDETRALAVRAANGDQRVRVVDAPDLPDGWFGKQWACHTGAALASGSLLLFTDADTRHASDLLPRLVHAQRARAAALISVAGTQATHSFWEHAIQPAVFALLLARYGANPHMERARRSIDVIANGQCLMMTRDAYDAIGGHAAVRATVAEDLMLAQTTHARGLRVSLVLGTAQLTTHMYSGLRAIVRGWMKNVYAGGRLAMWGGRFGQWVFPLGLVGAPFAMALPFLVLPVALWRLTVGDASAAVTTWGAISAAFMLWYFAHVNSFSTRASWRVMLVPLGALVFSGICLAAVVRGRRVEWKGREYRAA